MCGRRLQQEIGRLHRRITLPVVCIHGNLNQLLYEFW
jgi:hypothetical protein